MQKASKRKERTMPIPLQLKKIREYLRKANPDLAEEIDFETENYVPNEEGEYRDWTMLMDENAGFDENLGILEEEFPHVNWRVPKLKEPADKARKSLDEYEYEGPEGPVYCIDSQIVVRPLKGRIKGIRYQHGRIQISLPGELIDSLAYVHIEFPNPPEIKKKVRRRKRALGYFQFDKEYYEDKRKMELRKARKEIRTLGSRKSLSHRKA